MIGRHQLSVIAIGNGTACRETEEIVSDVIANFTTIAAAPPPPRPPKPPRGRKGAPPTEAPPAPATEGAEQAAAPAPGGNADDTGSGTDRPRRLRSPAPVAEVAAPPEPVAEAPPEPAVPAPPPEPIPPAPADLAYVIVNEAGASVYSASPVGREEFPDFDATLRGTISIGRRLQDPLSELVKIDPQNIGVGLYQHDVNPKHLKESLEAVIESCVNHVGVDLNTASVPLLRHVSGLNQLVARELVDFRKENGPFKNREQLHAGARRSARRASCRRPASSRSPAATTRSTAPGFTPKAIRRPRSCSANSASRPTALDDRQKIGGAARQAQGPVAGGGAAPA